MNIFTPYAHDVVQVVKLGNHYQVKYLKSVMIPGYETSIDFHMNDDLISAKRFPGLRKKNNQKLKNNISRALTTCREIALSNDWQYFITLTLDPTKYDRFDLCKWHKDLSVFFRLYNRHFNCSIKYLLVPERHSNGAWHMHGLIAGIQDSSIVTNVNGYISWDEYCKRFGYCSLGSIKNSVAVSFYISKHLGKQLYNGVLDLNSHLYYCSRGLSRGQLVSVVNASALPDNFKFQYEATDGTYKSSFFEDGTFLKKIGLI